MDKVNSRSFEMSYQVFCQEMDCITTWKWKEQWGGMLAGDTKLAQVVLY